MGYVVGGIFVLCVVQSAAVLEVFMVRSKEEREKAVKRKRKKAQKRSVKEGATPVEVREEGEPTLTLPPSCLLQETEALTAAEEIPHVVSLSGKSKLRFALHLLRGGEVIDSLSLSPGTGHLTFSLRLRARCWWPLVSIATV